jgi:hypothetical protein
VEPIENAQNREEYLWENLEKLGNSLEKCFLRFNEIRGLVNSARAPVSIFERLFAPVSVLPERFNDYYCVQC